MIFRLLIAAAACVMAPPGNFASAAPQLLGLLADNEIPVHCVGDVCTLEVSAICLQKGRDCYQKTSWRYRAVRKRPSQLGREDHHPAETCRRVRR